MIGYEKAHKVSNITVLEAGSPGMNRTRQMMVAVWRLLASSSELVHSLTVTHPKPCVLIPIRGPSLPGVWMHLPHPRHRQLPPDKLCLPSYAQPHSKVASCSPSFSKELQLFIWREHQAINAISSYQQASDVPPHDPDTGGTTKALFPETMPTEQCHQTEPQC